MPKTPILRRTLLFSRLRDNTIRLLDWTRVETSQGTGWESRAINVLTPNAPVTQLDVYDRAFTDIQEVVDGSMFQGLHGGVQIPSDFNTQ